MPREDAFKAKKQFLLTDQSTTIRTLLDGTNYKVLLNIGAIKSFMAMKYYLETKLCMICLGLTLKLRFSKLGMGQVWTCSFIIPTIVTFQGHMFKIYTMVSEIHGYKMAFEIHDNADDLFKMHVFRCSIMKHVKMYTDCDTVSCIYKQPIGCCIKVT